MADASIDPSAFKRQPYPFPAPSPSASGLWKFDKAINNYPRAHRELRRNFWVTPTVSCRLRFLHILPYPTFYPFLPFILSLSLSLAPLRSLCSSHYFIRFFFFGLTVKLSNLSHGYSTRSYGVRMEDGRTRCAIRPMSTSAIFAVVSIPHLVPSSFTVSADIELRDQELELSRV